MPDLRQVFDEVMKFGSEIRGALDSRLRTDFGLPLAQFELMSVISRYGSCRIYDVASELGLTTGGASKLVGRIEADELCLRRPNPQDRRSSLLELTRAGRTLLSAATRAVDDELEQRLGDLSVHSIQQLVCILGQLRAASRAADGRKDAA
jgi:DNA-binding MarR family transcriptional regulator